jgi:excisionase family DNA binding protein
VVVVSRHRRPDNDPPLSNPPPDDEILTTDEIAALLKIPKATLYRWVSMGVSPPFYKIGKHSRWKRSEVMAWFEARQDDVTSGC